MWWNMFELLYQKGLLVLRARLCLDGAKLAQALLVCDGNCDWTYGWERTQRKWIDEIEWYIYTET